MVTIQETDMKDTVRLAITKSKFLNKPVLISEIHKIDKINPLSFFYSGSELFQGERFFWKDPTDQTIVVGIGKITQIQSDQSTDRFFHVEAEWKKILEDALIEGNIAVPGIGPTLFGGFSFDPLKPKTDLWSKFNESLFYVPKYMLTVINGETFITTNIICNKHDNETLAEKTIQERTRLLNLQQQMIPTNNQAPIRIDERGAVDWKNSVERAVSDLKTGSLKKVVLARELRLTFTERVLIEPVLNHLINAQAESFVFAFEVNGDCFIGASPERLVKKTGNDILSTCLAGSIARGKSEKEDENLGEELLADQKNRIEHQYVVDMIKDALKEHCLEIDIPNQPGLMKMRDIQHLYTPVSGVAKKTTSLLQLVNDLHPTPALGGMPKELAVEKIRQVEELDRGFYAAPIGWLDANGDGEFAVAIRSGLIQGKEASLFAGCGIVENSDAESEFIETRIKFRPMLYALGGKDT
ncbi:isochorismate synthase [Pseudoneobacillus sp. C159]